MIRLAFFTLLAALALAAATPSAAHACSCMAQEQPQAFDEALAVFEGRVVSVSPPNASNQLAVELEVVRTWKGADAERITVGTASNSAACGYEFEPSQSYLVYTYSAEGAQMVSLCSRTALVETDQARADIAVMGAGVTPVEVRNEDDGEQVAPPVSTEPARAGCASCGVSGYGYGYEYEYGYGIAVVVLVALVRRGRRP